MIKQQRFCDVCAVEIPDHTSIPKVDLYIHEVCLCGKHHVDYGTRNIENEKKYKDFCENCNDRIILLLGELQATRMSKLLQPENLRAQARTEMLKRYVGVEK